jgi:hypothetical protein
VSLAAAACSRCLSLNRRSNGGELPPPDAGKVELVTCSLAGTRSSLGKSRRHCVTAQVTASRHVATDHVSVIYHFRDIWFGQGRGGGPH